MKLLVAPGDGRIHRTPTVVAYSTEVMPALSEIVQNSQDSDLFKQLANLVVSSNFDCCPFLVVRLADKPALFVFGNLPANVDGEAIDATATSTWVDRQLAEEFTIEAGDTSLIATFDDCLLIEGTVAGIGLRLTTNLASGSMTPNQLEEVPATASIAEEAHSATPDLDEAAAILELTVEAEDRTTVPEQVISPAADERLDVFGGDAGDEDFDPFADPESVDLEAIGKTTPVEDLDPAVDPAPPDLPADGDEKPDLEDVTLPPEPTPGTPETSQPAGLRPPPTSLPPPTTGGASAPPGLRPAPSPSLIEPIQTSDDAEEVIEAIQLPTGSPILRVDDGQEIEVGTGVYVGRYPSKKGLPEGFGEVVVQGEGVSRIHWALVQEASGAFAVEDLGSTSGTATIGPDGEEQAMDSGARRIIGPGTRITFGDRWAVFER